MLDAYSPIDRGDTLLHEGHSADGLRFKVVATGDGSALVLLGVFGHCCIPAENISAAITALQQVQKANGSA